MKDKKKTKKKSVAKKNPTAKKPPEKKIVKFGSKEFNTAMKKEKAIAAKALDSITVEIGDCLVELFPKRLTYEETLEINILRGREENPTDKNELVKFTGITASVAYVIVLMRDENGEKIFGPEDEEVLQHVNGKGWDEVSHRVMYLMGLKDNPLLGKPD